MTKGALPCSAAALAWLSLCLASCSSGPDYGRYRNKLDEGAELLAQGELDAAEAPLVEVLAETQTDHAEFAVQRFLAALLLAQMHLLRFDAASSRSWTPPRGPNAMPIDPAGLPRIRTLVQASFYAELAQAWAADARSDARSPDKVPAALTEHSVADQATNARLSSIAVASALDLEEWVHRQVTGRPELITLASCEEMMDRAGLDAAVRPWVYLALHEHLRRDATDDSARETCRFGLRALHTARGDLYSSPRRRLDEVRTWVLSGGGHWVFPCAGCDAPLDPMQATCECGLSNLERSAEKRTAEDYPADRDR